MSKSASTAGGIIEMLDDPKVSAKKIRSAVTDSGTEVRFDEEHKPGISNLLTIYSALTGRGIEDLEKEYDGRGYGDFKKDLADVVVDFVTPFRDRTLELLDDRAQLDAILADGCAKADAVAERTLADVYDRVGFVRPGSVGLPIVTPGPRTIGVAIAVPEPWGGQLQDYRTDLGDKTAAGIPTHITLMPPFEVPDGQMPRIEQHLAEASALNPAFKVHLRGTGTFRPVSPVVFVTVVEGISGCEQLALAIRRGPLEARAPVPVPPARHRGPPPRRRVARPGVRRALGLRVRLRGRPLLALRARRGRRLGPDT